MRNPNALTALTLAAALIVSAAAALAQSGGGDIPVIGPNVRITLTIVDVDGGNSKTDRTYRLMARDGAGPSRLIMGWRVPIPTTKVGTDDEAAPVTSYTYQNVGFTADLGASLLDDGRLLIRGQVEASGAKEGPQALRNEQRLPIIGTFQQTLNITVEPGKPMRVAEVPDPEGGRLHLEIQAEVVD